MKIKNCYNAIVANGHLALPLAQQPSLLNSKNQINPGRAAPKLGWFAAQESNFIRLKLRHVAFQTYSQ